MSFDYRPGIPPTDPYFREFTALQRAFSRVDATDGVPMTYLKAAPPKPRDGLYLAAAGVLGTNRGLYRYDSSTGSYTQVGF